MTTPDPATRDIGNVIVASSLGTVFEWYNFYLYAKLAPFFASLFPPRATTPRRCYPRSRPTRPSSSSVHSAPSYSAASAIS